MAQARCSKGHIYDSDIYDSCPYCDNGAASIDFSADDAFMQDGIGHSVPVSKIAAGDYSSVGLKSDGTVVFTGSDVYSNFWKSTVSEVISEWTDIVAVYSYDNTFVGLKSDGTVVSTDYSTAQESLAWTDIKIPEGIKK